MIIRQRKSKIIIALCIAIICTTITCIPIFAYTSIKSYFDSTPADLGTQVQTNFFVQTNLNMIKGYIKINNFTDNYDIIGYAVNNNNSQYYTSLARVTINDNTITITQLTYSTDYTIFLIPTITIELSNIEVLYLPIFCYNASPLVTPNYNVYFSTEANNTTIMRQYYEIGYNEGYNNGYNQALTDYPIIEEDMNIVQHITMLISRFTGNDIAPYITPIAVVLTILMVYFLFIRFLLSLIKAKGVIKVCDIAMLVACIIILVVMYAPMLDLTIKNETITQETTTEAVEQINRTNITIEHTETGDIYYGPVGTVKIPIYEIADDTEVRKVSP